jgi:tRNA uridine 5-carbamoylmethylation protein Kti12
LSLPDDNIEILKHTHNSTNPKNRTINLLRTFLTTEHKNNSNIIFDSVGTHVDLITELLNLSKENNYETTMILVRTDIDIAMKRNSERDRRLGDDVVIDYHQRVEQTLDTMFDEYDNVWIVNNNDDIDLANRKDITKKIK